MMEKLELLVKNFRTAIDFARDAGAFDKDSSLENFPKGCYGDGYYIEVI